MKNLGIKQWCSLVLAAGLLLCLCAMPYGYCTLIRLFTAVMGLVWAWTFYRENKKALMITSIIVAVLFQPILKITMDKGTWNIIDVVVAIGLIVLVYSRRNK